MGKRIDAVIISMVLLVAVFGSGPAAADVFLYSDRYSGTWHGGFGGHMYGRIQKTGE